MGSELLQTPIEYLKGVGPQKAAILAKELEIFTFENLLLYFPFRHEDRSAVHQIKDLNEDMPYIQVIGRFQDVSMEGAGPKKRLKATLYDGTGMIEVVWFTGVNYISKYIKPGLRYLVFGKPSLFKSSLTVAHPELEEYHEEVALQKGLTPVYNSSSALKQSKISNKQMTGMIRNLLEKLSGAIPENLPASLLSAYQLMPRAQALASIHLPPDHHTLAAATRRLKFEEIFFIQLKALMARIGRQQNHKGRILAQTQLLKNFYDLHLPFALTGAQKRVIRELFEDFKSGKQMNRLLQGDVGSGKTMVAFCAMLIAASSGAQSCLMAPTEILAEQHYRSLRAYADPLGIKIGLLTGSTRKSDRQVLFQSLEAGELYVLVGTHALLEDPVQFHTLGFCVIDEQHKFGVAQRARLWRKGGDFHPHILVMTATPIPRTLAMTVYGDLDVSVIDELPVGRKPIVTVVRYDADRLKVYQFVREQLQKGSQAYVIYPLVKESEALDLRNVEDGFLNIQKVFPEYTVAMVHGQLKSADKEAQMQRFVSGEAAVLVATTVIEVGVNVPNANVMIIENAERFGLAQLHQLRGRVGRGSDQSYCILLTDYKTSSDSKHRLRIMTKTTNGFDIANEDLKLRGPGDLLGTQQSGLPDLRLTHLGTDGQLIAEVRAEVEKLLDFDPSLSLPQHSMVRAFLKEEVRKKGQWSKIS